MSVGTIGFVGVGTMGRPMASRIRAAGYEVVLCDANVERADGLAKEIGARVATTPAELAPGLDAVVTMLPNSDVVETVLFGPDGFAANLRDGVIHIEMSSGAPEKTIALGERLASIGVRMIDAPVSGGVARAMTGDLSVMVGGDVATVDEARPLLGTMGSSIVRTGRLGSAHALKALNNLMSAAGFLIGIEALLIGSKFGLDPRTMIEVINKSTGMNNSTQKKFQRFVLSRDFNSGFSAELMVKDLGTALALAHSLGLTTPFAETCLEHWKAGLDELDPGADHTSITLAIERVAGYSLLDTIP